MGDTNESPLDASKYELHDVSLRGDEAPVHTIDALNTCKGGIDAVSSTIGDEKHQEKYFVKIKIKFI